MLLRPLIQPQLIFNMIQKNYKLGKRISSVFNNKLSYGMLDPVENEKMKKYEGTSKFWYYVHCFKYERWKLTQGTIASFQEIKTYALLELKKFENLSQSEKQVWLDAKETFLKMKRIMFFNFVPLGLPFILVSLAYNPYFSPRHFLTIEQYQAIAVEQRRSQLQAIQYYLQNPLNNNLSQVTDLTELKRICVLLNGFKQTGVQRINYLKSWNFQYLISPALSKYILSRQIKKALNNDKVNEKLLANMTLDQKFKWKYNNIVNKNERKRSQLKKYPFQIEEYERKIKCKVLKQVYLQSQQHKIVQNIPKQFPYQLKNKNKIQEQNKQSKAKSQSSPFQVNYNANEELLKQIKIQPQLQKNKNAKKQSFKEEKVNKNQPKVEEKANDQKKNNFKKTVKNTSENTAVKNQSQIKLNPTKNFIKNSEKPK